MTLSWFVGVTLALLGFLVLGTFVAKWLNKPDRWSAFSEKITQHRGRLSALGLLSAIGLAVAGGLSIALLAYLLLRWTIGTTAEQADPIDVTKLALTLVAGVGGTVALVVAYRRQRDLEQGRFVERFGAAASQLGSPDVAIRIAGVYAMAGVADETLDYRRQQCIDVLCGYLRLPYEAKHGADHNTQIIVRKATNATSRPRQEDTEQHFQYRQNDREVRQTIVRVLTTHLQLSAATSWSKSTFDFTGVTFEDSSFEGAIFAGGYTSFAGATFTGTCDFESTTFEASVDFSRAQFSCELLSFERAVFMGSRTDFGFSKFSGDHANFKCLTVTGGISFKAAVFTSPVNFRASRFSGPYTLFGSAVFTASCCFDGSAFSAPHLPGSQPAPYEFSGREVSQRTQFRGEVSFFECKFLGERTTFEWVNFQGGEINFKSAVMGGRLVSFRAATFGARLINFDRIDFGGEYTDFTGAVFWSRSVSFLEPTRWRCVAVDWEWPLFGALEGPPRSLPPLGVRPTQWPPTVRTS